MMTRRKRHLYLLLALVMVAGTAWYQSTRVPLPGLDSPDSVALYSIEFRYEEGLEIPPENRLEKLYPDRKYLIIGKAGDLR